jgi:IS30 family transposase
VKRSSNERPLHARRAAREKRRRNHLRDARGVRPYRSSSAKINHLDNDKAFAQRALLRTMRDMTTWFCDAYASWQKGGIENANGRLRR